MCTVEILTDLSVTMGREIAITLLVDDSKCRLWPIETRVEVCVGAATFKVNVRLMKIHLGEDLEAVGSCQSLRLSWRETC